MPHNTELFGSDLSEPYSPWRGNVLLYGVAAIAVWIWRWNGDRPGQRPLLGRITYHGALLAVLALVLLLGTLQWDTLTLVSDSANWNLLQTLSQEAQAAGAPDIASSAYRPSGAFAIARRAEPHTAIPERPRLMLETYTVQPGDTTQSVAAGYGLEPTTIMWSNPEVEKAPDLLRVGQLLVILPLDGVYHTVEEGDTLESLAQKYKVEEEVITSCPYNTLPQDGTLAVGDSVIVPGGTKPYVQRTVTTYTGPVPETSGGSGRFRWPATGTISQYYWYGHRAIDIANGIGTAIVAADAGYVSFAGWTDIGYGYLVVVDHTNGYQTYYAHLSNIFVYEGQTVSSGEVLGAMGSTGYSTGPHLHFEIRYSGYPTNPLIHLP